MGKDTCIKTCCVANIHGTLKYSIQNILFTKYLYKDVLKHNKCSCILIIPLTKMYICYRLNKHNVEIKISRVKCAQCIIVGAPSPSPITESQINSVW